MNALELDADVPPSARHVAHVLQEAGPCTQPELIDLTTLPETTVDDALACLVEADLVTIQPRRDGRGRTYRFDD